MKIGMLTIGQSPRDDVIPEFLAAVGASVELLQKGALDGLGAREIRNLAPQAGDYVLVTRLRDGTEVSVAEERILDRMRLHLRELEEAGASLVVLFCTGEFPALESRIPVLRPNLILENLASSVFAGGRLCAVVPSAGQIDAMRMKWSRRGFVTEVEVLSPYSSSPEEIQKVAVRAAQRSCDLVVLDCIGYSGAIKAVFREACGKPVLLPRTVLGRVVAEMIGP